MYKKFIDMLHGKILRALFKGTCIYCMNRKAWVADGHMCLRCFINIQRQYGKFTCRGCKDKKKCLADEYHCAWDIYSTNGDCLWKK